MKILKVPKSKVENFVDGGEGGGDYGIDKGHYKKILKTSRLNSC